MEILATDQVMTAEQLWRYYGLGAQELAGVPHIALTLAPQHMRPKLIQEVTLYAATERILRVRQATDLGHLVGTAEIRHQLGIAAADWQVLRHSSSSRSPDAEYKESKSRKLAVEYDTGTYTRNKIDDKVTAFREMYNGIIWGALSRVRRERLRDRYPDMHVVDATWWK